MEEDLEYSFIGDDLIHDEISFYPSNLPNAEEPDKVDTETEHQLEDVSDGMSSQELETEEVIEDPVVPSEEAQGSIISAESGVTTRTQEVIEGEGEARDDPVEDEEGVPAVAPIPRVPGISPIVQVSKQCGEITKYLDNIFVSSSPLMSSYSVKLLEIWSQPPLR